jgi:hypothetical protein
MISVLERANTVRALDRAATAIGVYGYEDARLKQNDAFVCAVEVPCATLHTGCPLQKMTRTFGPKIREEL